jgi:hypothetical protein
MSWAHAVTEETDGEVIAIDGKTAKGSRDHKKKQAQSITQGERLGLQQQAGAWARGHG